MDDKLKLINTDDIKVEEQNGVLIITLKKDLKEGDTIKIVLPET